ncbi:hypothetical protein M885DRAFT_575557 [Pelagophyceae sp. CCMP2097]|nr:hypothetical protein M885DRAFT_575557 [Pelagophyceae sp. CCMP2097]
MRLLPEAAQQALAQELDYFGLLTAVFGARPWTDFAAFRPGPAMREGRSERLNTTEILDVRTMAFALATTELLNIAMMESAPGPALRAPGSRRPRCETAAATDSANPLPLSYVPPGAIGANDEAPANASPLWQVPLPGSIRKMRYRFDRPSEVILGKECAGYGAFVHVVGLDAGGAMIGVVVDVAMALSSASENGESAIVVARAAGAGEARVRVGKVAKDFPFTAAECDVLLDEPEDGEEDAGANCRATLEAILELAAVLDADLGALDELGMPKSQSEWGRMRTRLAEVVAAARGEDFESTEVALEDGIWEADEAFSYEDENFPPRAVPESPPLSAALLRPGRAIQYFVATPPPAAEDEDEGYRAVRAKAKAAETVNSWVDAEVVGLSDMFAVFRVRRFDGVEVELDLTGSDRNRWRLLQL